MSEKSKTVRVALRLFSSALLTIGVLTVTVPEAEAYRRPNSSPCTPNAEIRWRFANTGSSTSTDRDTFRANVDDWDTLRGADDNQFIWSVETTSSVDVDVLWVNNETPETKCNVSPRLIEMNPLDTTGYIALASTHEAGHAHGLRHSGRTDNLTPEGAHTYPMMGCSSLPTDPADWPTGPRGDDVAQAFTRFGPRATPNWGFENALSWWTPSSSSVVLSPTEYSGVYSALIPPGESIRTRVRIAEPGLHRMVARYRSASSNPTGDVRFQVSMVGVNYTSYPFGVDGCPNLNNFGEGSTIQYPLNEDRSPTNTWLLFSQNLATISGGTEGIRGSIWVYNLTNANLYVDNVALEER